MIMIFALVSMSMLYAQNPSDFKTYTLANGLTVVLDRDATQNEVFGVVATNAGSQDEELNATGMAHYLEHMLFKGTQTMGGSDWEKEKVLIEKTYALYDKLQGATSEEEIKQINKEINDVTQEASQYAIPNEISKLVQQMGGVGMNASTSFDLTQYYNAFPPNQLERWLDLYAHRFEKPVFRLFQTELETVYEEKNRAEDNPNNGYSQAMLKAIFGEHPYARPIIGYTEHLKKPWLSQMRVFYEKWYVPANMVLVLSGNFDIAQAEKLIAEKFGRWEAKPLPKRKEVAIKPFKGKERVRVKLSPFQRAELVYRSPHKSDKEELALDIASSILSNNTQTGLLDKLSLDGDVMFAGANNMVLKDAGIFSISFAPVFDINQRRQMSFSSAENLIDDQLNKLKKGDYEDWLFEQVKLNMLKSYKLRLENPTARALTMVEMFAKNKDFGTFFNYEQELKKMDKATVSEVVKKYIGRDYLAFYSSKGEAKKEKIQKPELDPIKPMKHDDSAYAKHFLNIPTTPAKREFVNLNTDVKTVPFQDKVKLHYVENKKNDIFSMNIVFHVGTHKIPMLKYTVSLMNNAGIMAQFKPDELRSEFGKLGLSYNFSVSDYYTTINLQGTEENLAEASQLISRLMLLPQIEDKALDRIIGMEYQNRMIGKDIQATQADALSSYIRYGDKSKYIDRLPLKELVTKSSSALASKLNDAVGYSADIHYYGQLPMNKVVEILKGNLAFASNRIDGGMPEEKTTQKYDENTIYLVNNSNASQSQIFLFINGEPIPLEKTPIIAAFNQYFSGGFNGLMMKEIREYRSLAYSAGASVSTPMLPNWNANIYGSIGTQADKTADAIEVLTNLLKNMPEHAENIKNVKDYLINSSYLARPSDRRLSYSIYGWKQKGYTDDPTKVNLPVYENMEFTDLVNFYNEYIKGKPYAIGIVGAVKDIDDKKLSKFGKVVRLRENKLFSKE